MKTWEKFYECSCSSEGLMISNPDFDEQIYVAFFKNGVYSLGVLSWKQRLRHIWQIITKGTVWGDEVILDYDEARRMGNDLIDISYKLEKRIKERN